MAFAGSLSTQTSFKLMLPDRMSCNVPFAEGLSYPFYKNTERYERCLNAAFFAANISDDRFCFMLEPGEDARTLELIIPALPSSIVGFSSPRTRRLLLFSALRAYLKNQYTYANKRYSREIKLLNEFMMANENSKALNFESQRQVDTLLASNISVSDFLKALITEPEIRQLWIFVKGKVSCSSRSDGIKECGVLLGVVSRISTYLEITFRPDLATFATSDLLPLGVVHLVFVSAPLLSVIEGKSGDVYRLRICDTELAVFKESGGDRAIHVWPWQEIGEPMSAKKEVRMPWLITDERPPLSDILLDVLQSKRPENLNDAKRRRLSRADSIPTPVVFDAKYHYTISVFAEDGNTANKLVYQICCIRAMALANENQPSPNAERASVQPRDDVAEPTQMAPSSPNKTQKKKKKGFSMCGLNCMGGKKKEAEDMEIDTGVKPTRRSADLAQPLAPIPEAATEKDVQTVVESPPVPQRKSSTSRSESIKGEVDSAVPDSAAAQSSMIKASSTSDQDELEPPIRNRTTHIN
ncbi:hypothetical protein Aperf_G00000066817 [Anoplocephala perfoliata]